MAVNEALVDPREYLPNGLTPRFARRHEFLTRSHLESGD